MSEGVPPSPDPEIESAMVEFERFFVALVGDVADIQRRSPNEIVRILDVTPHNPRACRVGITAEQFFHVSVGDNGWELGGYTTEDFDLAKKILTAAIEGRVTKRTSPARSALTVELEEGSKMSTQSVDGCAALLIPQLGWRRWGHLERYEPYRNR